MFVHNDGGEGDRAVERERERERAAESVGERGRGEGHNSDNISEFLQKLIMYMYGTSLISLPSFKEMAKQKSTINHFILSWGNI